MEQALLVGRQVLLVFLYVAIGMIAAKRGVFDEKAGRSLSNFCLGVVTPSVIIRGFIRPMDMEEAKGIAISFLLAAVFHVIATIAAILILRKRPGDGYRDERLAVVFANCGYMAIPLLRVASGETGVFFILGYISVFNICLWSIGYMLMTGSRKIEPKKILLNPGLIGFAIGALLYATQAPVPSILVEALDGISVFNTPLSMITIGIFLAGIKVKETFTNGRIYLVSLLRLLALPLIMLVLLKVTGVANLLPYGRDIALAVGLGCACPVAAAVTLLPARFGRGGEYGAQMIAVSTLLSVATLPLITLIINTWL